MILGLVLEWRKQLGLCHLANVCRRLVVLDQLSDKIQPGDQGWRILRNGGQAAAPPPDVGRVDFWLPLGLKGEGCRACLLGLCRSILSGHIIAEVLNPAFGQRHCPFPW
jgi:hypothetical protein